MVDFELSPSTRDNKYYWEGRDAYARHMDVDDCPYPGSQLKGKPRCSWMCGWYDHKYEGWWEKWLEKQTLGDQAKIKQILLKDEL